MSSSDSSSRVRPTVYPSGVDLWIALTLLIAPLYAAGIGIYLLTEGRSGDAMIFFITAVATMLVTASFTLPCRYTMLEDALSVRCGIILYQIPYDQIESVEPSSTWRSGPALSMRRVLITTNKRTYVLSPRERDRFIEHLRELVATGRQT